MDPSSWKKYVANSSNAKDFAAFSRYRARFRLARGLSAIEVDGLAQSTVDSYFVALRVTLAYTALESLETALDVGRETQVIDAKLLTQFLDERNLDMRMALLESISAKEPSKERLQFQKLLDGEVKNLRIAAYAIRNLMAHGVLTANRLGLDKSKTRRKLLNDLANCVLNTTDDRFTKHVSEVTKS